MATNKSRSARPTVARGATTVATAVETISSYRDHLKRIIAASTEVSLTQDARAGVMKELLCPIEFGTSDIVSAEVLAEVTVGEETRYLITGGHIVATREISYERAGAEGKSEMAIHRLVDAAPFFVTGSSPAVKEVAGVRVRAGVCALIGRGGVGKTPVAHAMAGAGEEGRRYSIVRFGEPFAGYGTDHGMMAERLLTALVTSQDVVLDSVKDLLAGGGAAMKSGLSRGALVQLSSWSIAAANLGATIYIPINPSSDDPEVEKLLVEAARSNVTSVMTRESDNLWSYTSRSGEGGQRSRERIPVSWADGFAQIPNGRGTAPTSKEIFGVRFSDDVLAASVQRSLLNTGN